MLPRSSEANTQGGGALNPLPLTPHANSIAGVNRPTLHSLRTHPRPGREKSIWQIRRSRLCRVERQQVMTLRTRIAVILAGGLLWTPVAIGMYLMISSNEGSISQAIPIFVIQMAVTLVNLLAILMAVSSPSRAFTTERDQGTLEALMLTPMSPKEIVWSKFWARTAPVRTFVWVSAPAYVLAGIFFCYAAITSLSDDNEALYAPLAAIGIILLIALVFGIQLYAYHCVAALSIYISARSATTLKASLLSFGLVGGAVFCAGVPGTIVVCILGPVLLRQLVRNFDKYMLMEA